MERAEIEAIVDRWVKAVAAADLEALAALVADDVRDLSGSTPAVGRESFRARAAGVAAAFGDITVQVEELLVEGQRASWRWILSGSHVGPFAGFAPTQRRVGFRGVNFQRFAMGVVVEHWTLVDAAGLVRQLGE